MTFIPSNAIFSGDEGSIINYKTRAVNFTGAGVTATSDADGNVTIDIPGGGGGSTYTEVATYADLPAAASHSGAIYVVQTASGLWLITRKEAGLYRSDGSTWSRLGNWAEAFKDSNFQVYNSSDTSKKITLDASGVSASTTRTLVVQDKNGTIALVGEDTIPPELFYMRPH